MPKRFSKLFPTFFDWQKQASNTAYAKRMERLHYKYPNATLAQLSGRAKPPKLGLPIHLIDPRGLRPDERTLRNTALRARTQLKKNPNLKSVLKSEGISKENLLKYLGDAITIEGNSVRVKRFDKIPREMIIDEAGEEFPIIITNSKHGSIIGKYHNAKRHFLQTGDSTQLRKFKKVKIKDADGSIHTLETNPSKIIDIEGRKEEDEFFEIYQD